MATVVTRTRQRYALRTLPVLLLFLLWLSFWNTSEVWTICHLFYCASKKHFALVIKFYENLIALLIRHFKEPSLDQQNSEEVLHWSVKLFHLFSTFSHSISALSSKQPISKAFTRQNSPNRLFLVKYPG